MSRPLLYTYRRCPYAMRARMALLAAGCTFDAFEVVLRDKPPALLVLSPKGTVPVLQLRDGGVIDESWEIMGWALSADDPQGVWRRAQSADNLALLACNDGDFKRQLDRYKYPSRHGDVVDPLWHRAEALRVLLLPLEARLASSRFLGGEQACATDFAIFPFIRQFAAVEPAWFAGQALPALQAWLATWLESPLFAACMARLPSQTMITFPSPSALKVFP